MSTASGENFVEANGVRLCWQGFGDPAAEPLLLIMGLGAQMVLWDDAFCAQLADLGYYVVRFDNRDIGRSQYFNENVKIDLPAIMMAQLSGKTVPSPYKLWDMAADCVGLLDALGIARAHVVGASMGGMIAQELALRHGARVKTLTSIMSSTGSPTLPGPKPEAAAVLFAPPPAGRDEYIAAFCRTWQVLRAGDFPEDAARDPERAARIWDRGLNPAGVARQFLAILTSGDRTARLAELTTPTLVIHGTPDPLVPIEAGRATHAAIKGSRMLELERMGHAMPVALWPEIIGALREHCR